MEEVAGRTLPIKQTCSVAININCEGNVLHLDETVVLVLDKGRQVNEFLFPEALHHQKLNHVPHQMFILPSIPFLSLSTSN
jgi:hypothetical protein